MFSVLPPSMAVKTCPKSVKHPKFLQFSNKGYDRYPTKRDNSCECKSTCYNMFVEKTCRPIYCFG